jgi:hypothetical protein
MLITFEGGGIEDKIRKVLTTRPVVPSSLVNSSSSFFQIKISRIKTNFQIQKMKISLFWVSALLAPAYGALSNEPDGDSRIKRVIVLMMESE